MSLDEETVVILGAGPAGLTAAYELSQSACGKVVVLEADPDYLGGIARTVWHKGYGADIGGHRFFTKSPVIDALWRDILGSDFIERPRLSRIYYKGKFFFYPLRIRNALCNLGLFESFRCVLSFLKARLTPVKFPCSFEDWVCNQFGRRLFTIFFKSYTEKVWGMPCSQISADWAAQRIKGLSLGAAILNALRTTFFKSTNSAIKTLIEKFYYPRRGPGMMWDAVAKQIEKHGGMIKKNQRAVGVSYDKGLWTITAENNNGLRTTYQAQHLVSTAPLHELGEWLPLSPAAKEAAQKLRYRAFLIVALVVKDENPFADNWIYIHDPFLKVGRIQNFKSWSPALIPIANMNCLGLEYFCCEGDALWTTKDEDLARLAIEEIQKIGLVKAEHVVDTFVVRQPKAYPVYDDDYKEHIETLRNELQEKFPSLHLAGRNGMHRYNNMDHAMMTGLLTAKNIIAGNRRHDVWRVNDDASYHEEIDRAAE